MHDCHVCQKFSLRVLLSFCLFFCQFQLGVAYKSVTYKKKRVNLWIIPKICKKLGFFVYLWFVTYGVDTWHTEFLQFPEYAPICHFQCFQYCNDLDNKLYEKTTIFRKIFGLLIKFTMPLNLSIIFRSKYWKNENTQNDKAEFSTADFL